VEGTRTKSLEAHSVRSCIKRFKDGRSLYLVPSEPDHISHHLHTVSVSVNMDRPTLTVTPALSATQPACIDGNDLLQQ